MSATAQAAAAPPTALNPAIPQDAATLAGHRPGSEAWVKAVERERKQLAEWEEVAKECRARWEAAAPADRTHGYLQRKGIVAPDGPLPPWWPRQEGTDLVIAMKGIEPGNPIMSLQTIPADPGSKKLFTKGARAGRCFTSFVHKKPKAGETIFVCEGFATGWAIHHVTGAAVVSAFSSGNLKVVACEMRRRYPEARIVLAADNDHHNAHNTGVTTAREAADAGGGEVAIPDFVDREGQTDYNDLLLAEGADAVKRWLDPERASKAVTTPPPPRAAPPPTNGGRPHVDGPEIEPSAPESATASPGDHLTLTDTGNAGRLVALHGARLHFVAPWRKYMVWEPTGDGGRWTVDYGDVRVRELAKDVGHLLKREAAKECDNDLAKKKFAFALKSLNASGISGMVDLARGLPGIIVDHEALDRDGWLFGVENGVIDLRTGEVRPARPTDLMTMQAPVRWDPEAQAPRWRQALEEWFPDAEVRAYVQRVAGSALVGIQRDHVFVIHYGGGRNGKGTFTRALQRVMGPYSLVIHLSLLVQQKYTQHDTVKAELFRARLAVASETQRRVKLDEASVKNLTGGDRITARRMREDPWEFDPSHSLWLQTNHLPEIAGRDQGIWSRIRVVRWESCFSGREDKRLDETLAAEAPGILRWLAEGCLAWQEHGLAEPEAVIRETLAYRQSEDTFSRFAAEVGLVFQRGLEIQAQELQALLEKWAEEEGVNPPRQDVGEWLREKGVEKRQRRVTGPDGHQRRPKFWVGVGFEDGAHETEQTDVLE
ncbi:MAG: phage/plasmid primase, P4 family [Longimicrobiales bacterium]